ncbi:replication protein [Paenibacillus sp. UKAQ_18]|nr:replication protein [Paenibacillus sp. UKAQ_18]
MSSHLDAPFTRITNEILEEIAKRKFNGTQYGIIISILRNTYGFQRKSHGMSLTFIAEATDTKKAQVKRELDKLIEMKVIKVYAEGTYTTSREIGFNKNFSEWQIEDSTLNRVHPKKSIVPESEYGEYPNQSTGGVPGLGYQERKSFKENLKEITTGENNDFEKVNKEYGRIHQCMGLKPSDWPTVTELLSKGVQADLIINVMEEKHAKKVEDGGKVHSFSFYTNAIKEKHKGKGAKSSRMSIFDELERELG